MYFSEAEYSVIFFIFFVIFFFALLPLWSFVFVLFLENSGFYYAVLLVLTGSDLKFSEI